jgi:deoxyribose-phosphate aldolase
MDHVEQAPALKYQDLASRTEIALLDPGASEEAQAVQLREALALDPAVIVVRPGDVDWAARFLPPGQQTVLAAVCGYPHGSSTTAVKLYEARDLLRRGAREIHATVSIAKLQSRQFQHVEMELIQLAQACHEAGAKLKAVFEAGMLGEEQILVACKIAKRSETDMAQAAWTLAAQPGEEVLLRKCPPLVRVVGPARSEESAFAAFALGFDRVVLDDWASTLKAFRIKTAPQPVVT